MTTTKTLLGSAQTILDQKNTSWDVHRHRSVRLGAMGILGIASALQSIADEQRTANLLKAEELAVNSLRTEPPLTPVEKKIIERLEE